MPSAEEIEIPLSLYLWRRYATSGLLLDTSSRPVADAPTLRIRQLGTRSIMGVPGDMNLELLDYLNEVDGMSWGILLHIASSYSITDRK